MHFTFRLCNWFKFNTQNLGKDIKGLSDESKTLLLNLRGFFLKTPIKSKTLILYLLGILKRSRKPALEQIRLPKAFRSKVFALFNGQITSTLPSKGKGSKFQEWTNCSLALNIPMNPVIFCNGNAMGGGTKCKTCFGSQRMILD